MVGGDGYVDGWRGRLMAEGKVGGERVIGGRRDEKTVDGREENRRNRRERG